MTFPSATRRQASAALVVLVGLVAFAAVSSTSLPTGSSWPASPWTAGAASDSPLAALGPVSAAHPDFVGVAERRPASVAALLLIAPLAAWSLAAWRLSVGFALLIGRSTAGGSRLRRWRARLVGAPPLAS